MGMEMKLQFKLQQQLVMTPQLVQAIRLLQLSRLELVDEIRKELDGNPVLADDATDPKNRGEMRREHGHAQATSKVKAIFFIMAKDQELGPVRALEDEPFLRGGGSPRATSYAATSCFFAVAGVRASSTTRKNSAMSIGFVR